MSKVFKQRMSFDPGKDKKDLSLLVLDNFFEQYSHQTLAHLICITRFMSKREFDVRMKLYSELSR